MNLNSSAAARAKACAMSKRQAYLFSVWKTPASKRHKESEVSIDEDVDQEEPENSTS